LERRPAYITSPNHSYTSKSTSPVRGSCGARRPLMLCNGQSKEGACHWSRGAARGVCQWERRVKQPPRRPHATAGPDLRSSSPPKRRAWMVGVQALLRNHVRLRRGACDGGTGRHSLAPAHRHGSLRRSCCVCSDPFLSIRLPFVIGDVFSPRPSQSHQCAQLRPVL